MFPIDSSGWLEFFSRWYIWLSFAAIIFGGLALAASNGIRIYSARLGAIQAKEIAEARRQAAIADEGAAKANARAAQLEVESKKSGELIADANARASEANARAREAEAQVALASAASKDAVAKVATAEARIAEANRAAAEANRVAEQERLARLQLEARLADRILTPEQQARLAAMLSPFAGTMVDVVVFGDTAEIGIISGMILECLQKAGWVVHSAQALGGVPVRGVVIGTRPNADVKTSRASNTLISGLQSMGITSGPWEFEKMPFPAASLSSPGGGDAPVKIFIGSKPQ